MKRRASLVAANSGSVFRLIRWWSAAERGYLNAITYDPSAAGLHIRLGQVREHRHDWRGAEKAYRRAVELDDSVGNRHFRLGCVLEHQGDLAAAADAYAAAVAREPERKEWYVQAARAHERKPDLPAAIELYERARSRFGEDRALLQLLADAYESAGEWSTACEILRGLLAADPEDSAASYRLAVCLEKLGRVPFELKSGEVVPTPPHTGALASDSVIDEAITHFNLALTRQPRRVTRLHRFAGRLARGKRLFQLATRQLGLATRVHQQVARPETRLRRLHELGRMYERHGRLEDAAETYRTAVAGLETVDSIWVHKAEPAWRFRLAYVEERLTPSDQPDERLRRAVVPATPEQSDVEPSQGIGGFFEAQITDLGLHVEGFVLPDVADSVDIVVDGDLVKRIAVNARVWLRTFHFEISHAVLAEFPATARLTVSADGRPLLAQGGGHALNVRVPDGGDRLAKLLSTGYSISKKGVLARPSTDVDDRNRRYLAAYCEVKRTFEELTGKQLFLLYGTLLGCYRDGAFIAGDDDFDVSYVSDAADPVDLKREAQQTALTLLRAGFDICMTVTGRLFKVRFDDVWLDVNPVWFYRGRAWSFDSHILGQDHFVPVKNMPFLGHDVYVPHDIEAFLADNYGPNWRTPQPDFRYYRNETDRRILRRSWLTPREAREFSRLTEAERQRHPSAGRFLGIGDPADAGFS